MNINIVVYSLNNQLTESQKNKPETFSTLFQATAQKVTENDEKRKVLLTLMKL